MFLVHPSYLDTQCNLLLIRYQQHNFFETVLINDYLQLFFFQSIFDFIIKKMNKKKLNSLIYFFVFDSNIFFAEITIL